MAKIVLPGPDVVLVNNDGKINSVWFQKLTQWLRQTNEVTFTTNGKLTVAVTSDTNIRFSYLGSDGVTRTADVTLS